MSLKDILGIKNGNKKCKNKQVDSVELDEARKKYNQKYDWYIHLNEIRSHIVVENAIYSIFSTIDGLEDMPCQAKRDIETMKKMIKKHLPDIVNFMER